MADFKKLSSVEAVNEVTDNMSLLIENNGNINKVSKNVLIKPADWETLENKPFYDATTFTFLVTNYLVDFSDSENHNGVALYEYDSNIDANIVKGESIRIIFDDAIYDLSVQSVWHMGDEYYGTSMFVHKGNRFTVILDSPFVLNMDNVDVVYSLSICRPQINIKTLDEKFMPEYDLVFKQVSGSLDTINMNDFLPISSEKIQKTLQKIIEGKPVRAIYQDRRNLGSWLHCADQPLAISAYISDSEVLSVNCHTFVAFDVEGWVGAVLEFVYESSEGTFTVGCSPIAIS